MVSLSFLSLWLREGRKSRVRNEVIKKERNEEGLIQTRKKSTCLRVSFVCKEERKKGRYH